jgi:two-component system cell cycle response regulator DivK
LGKPGCLAASATVSNLAAWRPEYVQKISRITNQLKTRMKLFEKWRKKTAPAVTAETAFDPAPAEPTVTPQEASLGQNRKILVVDDNPVVLKAFELKLRALGFQVLTVGDGAGAVSIARNERPDLIVLDINFPPEVGSSGLQWDGFNIMQWMQRFQEAANIPVIIITSGDPAKLRDRALAAGAVAFFEKPINHEKFLVAVQRAIGQSRAKSQAA